MNGDDPQETVDGNIVTGLDLIGRRGNPRHAGQAVLSSDDRAMDQHSTTAFDDARRQIAMMRLIMSKDQLERSERSREDVIKLRSAA